MVEWLQGLIYLFPERGHRRGPALHRAAGVMAELAEINWQKLPSSPDVLPFLMGFKTRLWHAAALGLSLRFLAKSKRINRY